MEKDMDGEETTPPMQTTQAQPTLLPTQEHHYLLKYFLCKALFNKSCNEAHETGNIESEASVSPLP